MSSLAFKDAVEIAYGYREQRCIDCGKPHLVPPWFKPFKDYCEESGCRQRRIGEYAGLDREPDIEDSDDEQNDE